MNEIIVIAEGATERIVGKVLYDNKILSHNAKPSSPDWTSRTGSREGFDQVIKALKEKNPIAPKVRGGIKTKALLIFDQEEASSPLERAKEIEAQLKNGDHSNFWRKVNFKPIDGSDNLFEHKDEHKEEKPHIVLHISSAYIDGIPNRDFDGYILQILQGKYGKNIIQHLAPQSVSIDDLIRKSEKEITELMRNNGVPWTHAKSWLYAYITVLQYKQSHVWFAQDVVREAINISKDYVAQIFESLVFAWHRLAMEELP
jgi:hypothetical protein